MTNANGAVLSQGQERGWRFSGKRSFHHAVSDHGLGSGTGLGSFIELDTVKEWP